MGAKKSGRSAKTFARRGPTREPYDVLLIVCEGTKTEPNYLIGLRNAYRLSNANIKILHASGTDPVTIVQFTQAEMAKDQYDRAYCVFDRDGHQNYDEALRPKQEGQASDRDNSLAMFRDLDPTPFHL